MITLPRALHRALIRWAERTMASREFDFPIGGRENPYMLRWWVIPRNPVFNIYLHRFLRDDEDRALHDHPWVSCSVILQGGYYEHLPDGAKLWRMPGAVLFRRATAAHRVSLERAFIRVAHPDEGGASLYHRQQAITLFITGPRLRRWGFHCPKGWVFWEDFCAPEDKGSVGRGCGE